MSEFVDVSVAGSTKYNIVLFLTTGIAGTGTFMYRLSGTKTTVHLQQVQLLTYLIKGKDKIEQQHSNVRSNLVFPG